MFFSNVERYRGKSADELYEVLETVAKLWKENKVDEKLFLDKVIDCRQRLEDSQLSVLSRRMREIMGFKDLIQISNTVIDSVVAQLERDLQRDLPEGRATILEIVKTSAEIRKINNDVSEGINQPTLDKLRQFDRDFRAYGPQVIDQQMQKEPSPTIKERLKFLFS